MARRRQNPDKMTLLILAGVAVAGGVVYMGYKRSKDAESEAEAEAEAQAEAQAIAVADSLAQSPAMVDPSSVHVSSVLPASQLRVTKKLITSPVTKAQLLGKPQLVRI